MQPEINTQQQDKKHKKKNRALLLLLVILLLLVGFISNGMFSFLSRNTLNRNNLLSAPPLPLQSNIPTDITFDDNREPVIPTTPEETPPLIASTSRIRPLVSVPTQPTPMITIPNSPSSIIINATLGSCNVICASVNTSIISGNLLILERGIVYDTNPNPTIEDSKIIHSDNQLSYNSEIQNMRIINTYYIRSYAITPSGITYSNQIEINKPLSTPHDTEPTDIAEVFSNLEGEGTPVSPYIITNDWELQSMTQDLDAYYRLGNNIDARGTVTWNEGRGFTPIGGDGFNDTPFTGHFDGNGYGIIGLTIDREGTTPFNEGYNYYIGLFARTDGAKLYNVILQDHYILGKQYVGSVVGHSNGETEIRNAFADGISWARFGLYGGGLIGEMNNGLIDNSFTGGQVRGSGNVIGGLVGQMENGTITNSTSNADIDGGGALGGIVGRMRGGQISNTCANGNILGIRDESNGKIGSNAGGFVGDMSGGVIRDSHATGNITIAETGAGGFVGQMSNSTSSIIRSYATGDVFIGGLSYGGGFVGLMLNVNPLIGGENNTITIADTGIPDVEVGIHNSYATGDVTFTNGGYDESILIVDTTIVQWTPEELASQGESFGGFVGANSDSVTSNSYSTGRVIYDSPGFTNPTNKGFTGRMTYFFLNENSSNLINLNNYWSIETSQQESSAGNATGLTNSQMLQQDSFNTWNFNTIWQSNGTSTPQLRNNANCKFTCFKTTPRLPIPIDCVTPPITDNLILYLDVCSQSYPGAGTAWKDLSSNNFIATPGMGQPITYNQDDGGNFIFDNTGYGITFPTPQPLSSYTYNTWIKPLSLDIGSSNYINTFESSIGLDSFSSYVYLENNIIILNGNSAVYNELISDYDYTDYQYNTGITLEADKWYNIAITHNNNDTIKVYINGILAYETPTTNDYPLTQEIYYIGSNYQGNLSHASLYDRALNQDELEQFFNATKSRFLVIGD